MFAFYQLFLFRISLHFNLVFYIARMAFSLQGHLVFKGFKIFFLSSTWKNTELKERAFFQIIFHSSIVNQLNTWEMKLVWKSLRTLKKESIFFFRCSLYTRFFFPPFFVTAPMEVLSFCFVLLSAIWVACEKGGCEIVIRIFQNYKLDIKNYREISIYSINFTISFSQQIITRILCRQFQSCKFTLKEWTTELLFFFLVAILWTCLDKIMWTIAIKLCQVL